MFPTTNTTVWSSSLPQSVFNHYPSCFRLFSGLIAALHTQTTSWTLTVPPVTKGLPGSCVVIPCLFDFPAQKNEMTEFTGMWKDAGENLICHSTDSEVMPMYRNRTRLVGNLAQKDCSLGIDPLNPSDVGPFHFRIEIAQLDSFSYVRNIVSIVMISKSSNAVFHLY